MTKITLHHDVKYWYFFLLLIFLGSATILTDHSLESVGLSGDENSNVIISMMGKFGMFLFATFLMVRNKVQITRCYKNWLFVLIIIWTAFQYVKYRSFSPYPIMRLMNIYFAFSIIEIYRYKIIYYYEDIVYRLSFIGIILWLIYIIAPNIILSIMELSPIKVKGLEQFTIFIWGNMKPDATAAIVPRNCGFAWEPGRYGCIVAVAIFFNLIIHNFKLKKNKRLIVLILALLSSLSTTAYSCLGLLVLYYLYNVKIKYFFFVLPFVIFFFVYMFSLDFIGDKMESLWPTNDNIKYDLGSMMDYYASTGEVFVPQRFYGLYLEMQNIIHEPFIGNATDPMSYLQSVYGVKMSLSNGALRIFANMGVVFGFLYYRYMYKISRWMHDDFCYNGAILYMVLFIFINISYSFIFEPVFLALVLMPYYHTQKHYESR